MDTTSLLLCWFSCRISRVGSYPSSRTSWSTLSFLSFHATSTLPTHARACASSPCPWSPTHLVSSPPPSLSISLPHPLSQSWTLHLSQSISVNLSRSISLSISDTSSLSVHPLLSIGMSRRSFGCCGCCARRVRGRRACRMEWDVEQVPTLVGSARETKPRQRQRKDRREARYKPRRNRRIHTRRCIHPTT